ncbi:MAG: thioredoxin domain-containing protein [Proteobacteria bacterium]|nr:thioredoxin domain-containing protein [Pseudomonadota bacterium]
MFEMKIVSKKAVIVLASLCALSFAGCKMKEAPAPAPAAPAAEAQATANGAAANAMIDIAKAEPAVLNLDALPTKGNPNAKVTLVEFSDYECPFCSRVEPTIAELLKQYPNDIRVAFINYPLPFHKNALPAAKAAVAAMKLGGNDAYWKMHEKCFANQKALTPDNFKKWAGEIGLDAAAFEAAMNSDEVAKYVEKGMKGAGEFGVTGTPAFIINGVKLSGAQPIDKFKAEIDNQIKRADDVAKAKNLSGKALYDELVKTAPKPPAPPKPDTSRKMVDLTNAPVLAGDPNAPVTIVEFTDFECPFCSRANDTVHQLIEKNPGKAKLVYRAYPLSFHKNAQLAHQAAEAAKKQGKFVEYYDILFKNQKALGRDKLIEYAKSLGLDEAKFVADMDSPETVAAVKADQAAGNKAGVNGTPHFLFNGRALSGAQPLEKFQATLDEEVKVANDLLAKGVAADKLYEEIIKRNINGGPAPAPRQAAPAPAPAPELPMVIPQGESYHLDVTKLPMKGNKDAKVTIVEFSDYECPYCSRAEASIKALLDAYPNDVRVAFVNMPLPFHRNARPAAMAALAAGQQGKYWEMHEKLFANQRGLNEEFYIKAATELGLDIEKFKNDMKDPNLNGIIQKGINDAQKVGLGGTPSFLINGVQFVGAQPVENFKKVVDAELERAKRVETKCSLSGEDLYKKLVEKAPKPKNPEDDYHFVDVNGAPVEHFADGKNVHSANTDALVTIVEYTDFQCPFCSRGNATLQELLKNNPGKFNVYFRHYPLPFHDKAQLAHQAAEAAKKQGKFWEYYDLLFANQDKLDRDNLIKFAKELGLDETKFVADMDSAEAVAAVKADLASGEKAGVQGTPHFLINGHIVSGAQPIQNFQRVLDEEYKKAEALKAKGITPDKIYEEVVKEEQNKKPVDDGNEC